MGKLRHSSTPLGPGVSWRPVDSDQVETASVNCKPEDVASKAEDDAQNAVELARMLAELFSQGPCALRLMGVRMSSFRGAQATLEKGQKRLDGFFASSSKPPESEGCPGGTVVNS